MAERQEALSVAQSSRLGSLVGCFGVLFGLVFSTMFFGIGSLFFWLTAVHPGLQVWEASSWVETPCTIIKSDVEGRETYRVEIEYQFTFDGKLHQGDQYDFFDMSTSGRTSKERIVAKYKEGSEHVCFVDPDDPTKSVLHRGLSAKMWWGLFPIPFMLIGLVGYWVVFFGRTRIKNKLTHMQNQALGEASLSEAMSGRPSQSFSSNRLASHSEWSDSSYDEEDLFEEPGSVTLAQESSPFGLAFFLLFFALVWNGIVSIFIFSRLENWAKLDLGFEDLILIPFVLIGIGVFIAAIYNFMAGMNPKPVLVLSRQLIPLGGAAKLQWRFPNGTGSLQKLKISLTGLEEARYRRGTNTYTDTETFCNEVLFETTALDELAEGEVEVIIPTEMMHSFNGGNNKVIWQIHFHGDIPMWPDINAKFPIRVVPHE